jgi:hypothetical protein
MKKITKKQKIRCIFWTLTTRAVANFYGVLAGMMLEKILR